MTKFVPTYINILQLHAVSVFFLFLPMMMNASLNIDHAHIISVCESRVYEDTMLVMITVSIVLMFEFFLDNQMEHNLSIPRFILVSSLVLPPVLGLSSSSLTPVQHATLFVICFEVQTCLLIGALLSALVEIQESLALKYLTLFTSVLSVASNNFWLWESFVKRTPATEGISMLFNFLFLVTLIWLLMVNCGGLLRVIKYSRGMAIVNALTEGEKYSIIFALTLTLSFVVKLLIFFLYGTTSWESIRAREVVLFGASDIFFGVVAISTTGRIQLARVHKQQVMMYGY